MSGEESTRNPGSIDDSEGTQSTVGGSQGPCRAGLPGVYLTGMGTCLGSTEVPLEEVGRRFDLSGKELARLQRKCGPKRLYRVGDRQSLEECALNACRNAIGGAAISPEEICVRGLTKKPDPRLE